MAILIDAPPDLFDSVYIKNYQVSNCLAIEPIC